MFRRNSQNCCMGVGANNVAYIPDTTLPLFNYFGTSGILPLFQWRVVQGEQFWLNQSVRVDGLPGIIAGQSAMQPLVDARGIRPV